MGSESVGQDILLAGRTAMNRALEGDIVAVELLPEEQWVSASAQLRKHDEAGTDADEVRNRLRMVLHLKKGSSMLCPVVVLKGFHEWASARA